MLPELPDEASEALSLSQKRLNPCGIDNVLWMHTSGQSAMLMSLTSCHVVATPDETNQVVLPVQPIPSTFVIDSQHQTSATNRVPRLDVSFGFDNALRQWGEFLKVAAMPNTIKEEGRKDGSREPLKSNSHGSTQGDYTTNKDSCDLTLEPFYQDLIRSSFRATKGSFVSNNPEMALKHLQMMTEKEAQNLDRIMKTLGLVGVFLLGLLWWSGREMFRASQQESIQSKRIQHAIQEMEQEIHFEENRSNTASPTAVSSSPPRRALSFVTPPPQQQQLAGEQPTCSAPTPLPDEPQDQSFYDAPPTILLSQEKAPDPFQLHGLSPVEKVGDSEHWQETSIHSKEDGSDCPEEVPVQFEEKEAQEYESDEESSPVLLLLTTSLSINRKHVAHQERMKTLLESNNLDQLEIVDGADPSKKALRNALFQLSTLRAVYPQLFVSRGSKLRFVGDMEKVQHLHDEGFMNKKHLFDSKKRDWQYLEDIISTAPSMDETFAYHKSASSTSTEQEDSGFSHCTSNPSLESHNTLSLVAETNIGDSIRSVDSVSPAMYKASSDAPETNSITGSEDNGEDARSEESMHSTDSTSMSFPQTDLSISESYSGPSIRADGDVNGSEDSIRSTDSVSSERTLDASNASTPSHSSKRSLSPFSKMEKAWEERLSLIHI